MTGGEGAEKKRGGEEKMTKGRERKKGKALMVSCSHTNTCQVFSGCLADTFWGKTSVKNRVGSRRGGGAKIFKSCLGFK